MYVSEHYVYNSFPVIVSTFANTSYITCVKDVMFNNVLIEGLSVKDVFRGGNR